MLSFLSLKYRPSLLSFSSPHRLSSGVLATLFPPQLLPVARSWQKPQQHDPNPSAKQVRVLISLPQTLSACRTALTCLEIAPGDDGMGHLDLIVPLWVKAGEKGAGWEGAAGSVRWQAAVLPPLLTQNCVGNMQAETSQHRCICTLQT